MLHFIGDLIPIHTITFKSEIMNGIKLLFTCVLIFTFFGIQPTQAQKGWDEGVAAVKAKVNPQAKAAVQKHLESIMFETFKTFKAGFRGQGISETTLKSYYKAAISATYINKQTAQGFKASSTLGFNIGMPPTVSSVLIIIPLRQKISKSQRLPYDMLGISTELDAALRKQGVNTSSSMAFLMDISELGIGNTNSLKILLK